MEVRMEDFWYGMEDFRYGMELYGTFCLLWKIYIPFYSMPWQQVGQYHPVFRLPFDFCFCCRFYLLHRRKCT